MNISTHKKCRRFIAVRLVSCLVLAMVAAGGLPTPVRASGIYTHNYVVGKAIPLVNATAYPELNAILWDWRDIVNYGAMFPDWGYTLLGNPNGGNIAEVAHSREFRVALMNILAPAFALRNENDRKAIAFLLGVISHQVQDTRWHDLGGNPTAFEPVMAAWDGDSPSTVELGADIFVARGADGLGTGYSYVLMDGPMGAVHDAYWQLGMPYVSMDLLAQGQTNQNAQLAGEMVLAWTLFVEWGYELAIPNTFNNLITYSPGGMNDGAALTAAAWMWTWDAARNGGIYYAKPAATGTGSCGSWTNACTLQTALQQAWLMYGGEVWAMEGTYKPTMGTDRTASIMLKRNVKVYGGFAGTENARTRRDPVAHPTILSGDIDNNDADLDGNHIAETSADILGNNSYHVVTVITGTSGALLDGFIITAGNANGIGCPGNGCGGGMQTLETDTLITNVTFKGNAANSGGGMFNWSSNNDAGKPHPTITNVTFSGNAATVNGGGMVNKFSRPSITNVTFSSNLAGDDGGGIWNDSTSIVVTHATFSGNHADHAGGAVYNYYCPYLSPAGYSNSIFWGNTAPTGAQGYSNAAGSYDTLHLYYSVVQGGCLPSFVCEGIIPADPLLGALGDHGGATPTFPLLPGSSAVDAADTTTFTCPSIDQRGVARPQGSACDIGAYEVDTTIPSLTSFMRQTPATSPTNADVLVFRATFNEAMQNVDAADFTVSGTTAAITLVAPVGTSAYDITVSGGDLAGLDGTVGLDLAAGQDITDMAENPLPDGEPALLDETYEVSNAILTLISFARQTPATSPTNADALVFRATFSTAAQNADATDFAVNGSTTALVTGASAIDARTYDITVSGGNLAGLTGTVGLDLAAGQNIVDLVGNGLPAGEPALDETYEVDNTAPSMTSFTRQTPTTSPTNADVLIFRASFNEAVQNVDAADFTVSGTTATIIAVAPVGASAYDITLANGDLPSFNGTVGLDLTAGQNIADLAGNALPTVEPGTDEIYVVDNTPPGIDSFTRKTPASSSTNADTLVFLATFDVDVQNVDPADFAVNGTTTATVTNVALVTASTYDVTVSGGDLASFYGTVGLDLAAVEDITDLVGNALPAGEPGMDEAYLVDNILPTLTSFTRQMPATSPTNSDTLIFLATFGEDVQNVDMADFAVNGTTTATVTNVAAVTASTYDITVAGGDLASFNGTVGLDLVSVPTIADLAGNALPAGDPVTDETFTVDNFSITVKTDSVIGQPENVVILNNGWYTDHFTYLEITYTEDADDPDGSGIIDDVTNPYNYVLLMAGGNRSYETSTCLAFLNNGYVPLMDDVWVATGPVTYDDHGNDGPFVATVVVNHGNPLPNGDYRLLICGTTSVIDLAGNPLGGGTDTITNFSIWPWNFPSTGFAPDRVTALPTQTTTYADLGDFWLEIPRLGVQLPIIGVPQANNTWDISWLGNNAGWLEGTAFPTWNGNSVLTAHVWNADNTAGPFVSLNTLWYGDQIIVHAWGQVYTYEVRSVKQVRPDTTTAAFQHRDNPWLTLLTCRSWDEDTGSYRYRVLVQAVLVSVK